MAPRNTDSPYGEIPVAGLKLTRVELARLREFVREVEHVIRYDDTGVTDHLGDSVLTAAEILGIKINNEDGYDV
jgi:hypothetical protein